MNTYHIVVSLSRRKMQLKIAGGKRDGLLIENGNLHLKSYILNGAPETELQEEVIRLQVRRSLYIKLGLGQNIKYAIKNNYLVCYPIFEKKKTCGKGVK